MSSDSSGEKAAIIARDNAQASPEIVLNLNGQRIGRKGMITRQRVLDAAKKLIADSDDLQISFSMIASEASLGMTSLYNYFSDLTDVLLALIEDFTNEAQDAYVGKLRQRWDDENLAKECREFVGAFFLFWSKHANVFHLLNNYVDRRDMRMIAHRALAAQEIIGLIKFQMDREAREQNDTVGGMAVAIYLGIERAVSVLNNAHLLRDLPKPYRPDASSLLAAEAQLFEFAIRKMRERNI